MSFFSPIQLKNGEMTTFIDYYKNKYHLTVTDPNQPLLIHNPTR